MFGARKVSKSIRFISICFAACAPAATLAQDIDDFAPFLYGHDIGVAQINKETSFHFSLYDGVSDGCWLNPDRSLSLAKREFLDAGYTNIVREYGFGVTVRLSAIGFETTTSQCAVHVGFEIGITDVDRREFEGTQWLAFSEETSFRLGSLLTGPKSDMSSRITEAYAGFVEEFIVHVQQEKNRLETAIMEQQVDDDAKAEFLNSLLR